MILLDTNVVWAVMAKSPDVTVVAWLDGQETLTTRNDRDFELCGLEVVDPFTLR